MSNEVPGGSHTPGPWIVSPLAKNLVATADDKTGIADVAMCGPWIPKPPIEQQDANALLIAAAPTMLAALQGALRIASLWIPSDDTQEEHWEEAKALYLMRNSFENAIAAARGAKA